MAAADPNLNGKALIYAMKNGAEYTGATISVSKVLVPEADFGANDVFEFFTTYIDS